jgi:hypothetical protein
MAATESLPERQALGADGWKAAVPFANDVWQPSTQTQSLTAADLNVRLHRKPPHCFWDRASTPRMLLGGCLLNGGHG